MAKLLVVAGADAFGQDLKNCAVEYLKTKEGVEVLDLGTDSYYSIAAQVARKVTGSGAKTGNGARTPVPSQSAGEAGTGSESGEGAGKPVENGGGGEYSTREDKGKVQGLEEQEGGEVRGLVVCGTGAGVTMVANKFPGVQAVCCNSPSDAINARSINNCNVLALSGLATKLEDSKAIIDAWLETKFKAPCPANKDAPWNEDIASFLDKSLPDIAALTPPPAPPHALAALTPPPLAEPEGCPICDLASGRVFEDFASMPGCSCKMIRDNPATAVVRFKKGSVEPAHHHTFSHDIIVMSGHKVVQNVTEGKSFELKAGDFLSTPKGSVHRVHYFEDTEFFIKFDGPMDILKDEDMEAAEKAVQETVTSRD